MPASSSSRAAFRAKRAIKPGSYSSECPKQPALVGAVKMALAIGILILVIAARTIIGETWLARIAASQQARLRQEA
jgi:hypothetical protein